MAATLGIEGGGWTWPAMSIPTSGPRRVSRAVKPRAYLIGEFMGDAGPGYGDRFDATMNYTFRDICVDFFAKGAIDAADLLERFLELSAIYARRSPMSHNLIGSHDIPRFLTVAGGEIDRLTWRHCSSSLFPAPPGCITATRWRWPAVTIRPTAERSPGTVATRFTGTGCVH